MKRFLLLCCLISVAVGQDYIHETFVSDDRALVKLPLITDVYENGEIRTQKCTADFLKTKFTDFGNCMSQVETIGVNCGTVKAKLACFIFLATSCLNTVDSQNLWNFVSKKEIERIKASDHPEILSQCEEIHTFEADLMNSVFGTVDKCTFEEGQQLIKARNQCHDKALAAKNEAVHGQADFKGNEDLSSKDQKYYDAYCELEKAWAQCYEETVFTCATPEKIGGTKERIYNAADELELDLQKSGLGDFSFSNCPHRQELEAAAQPPSE